MAKDNGTCTGIANLTEGILAPAGGLLLGHLPFVCGGLGAAWFDQCRILGHNGLSTRMSVPRTWAGYAVVNNGTQLFLVGGRSPSILKTSEFVAPGQPSVQGPDYPAGTRWDIKVTNLNATTLITSGGLATTTFSNYNVNYYFDVPSKNWTRAPNLRVARNHHNIGTMISNKHGRRTVVVVAGGISHQTGSSKKNVFTTSVEMLDPERNQFELGKISERGRCLLKLNTHVRSF